MSNADIRGQFVWHELMTTDTGGATAFYPKVVGWSTQPWEHDSSYTLWTTKQGPLGGVMRLPDDAGSNSYWLAYVGVPDIGATVADVQRLGGRVVKDVTEIPVGRFAIFADPQGATFGVYESANATPQGPAELGQFSWHELATTDYEAAMRFYQDVFGWEKGPTHNMGEAGMYQIIVHGGRQIGGIYNTDPSRNPVAWTCYVRVPDAGKAANAAKAGGGMVVNGPMEVPGGDWVAQIIDPQGAAFAVHEVKQQAQAQPKAEKPAQAAPARAAKPAASKPAAKRSGGRKAAAKKKAAGPKKKAAGKRRAAGKKAAAKKRPAKKAARRTARKTAARRGARKSAARKSARKHR